MPRLSQVSAIGEPTKTFKVAGGAKTKNNWDTSPKILYNFVVQ